MEDILTQKDGDMPRDATQVSVGSCDCCEAVHITLVNGDGKPYTRARIPLDGLDEFIDSLRAEAEDIRRRNRGKTN